MTRPTHAVRSVLVYLTLALCSATPMAAQTVPSADSFVKIDGKKNPEQIPEWLAWREAFATIATVDLDKSGFTRNLVLTPTEKTLLKKEAQEEKARQATCIQKQERLLEQMKAAPPETVNAALADARIDCRWATLDARDRLLEGLSPEAQASLQTFLAETRSAITSTVPKAELEMWRRPQ